jgi:molybdopterin synthase catalytic subunit
MPVKIRLQREDFDAAAEAAALTRGRTDIGALVTFTGLCRGAESGEPIAALTLEHIPAWPGEIARHVEEAQARWPLLGVTVIHRHGRIAPGENIVLVVTASSHREAACVSDGLLKTRAPFGSRSKARPEPPGSRPRMPTTRPPGAGPSRPAARPRNNSRCGAFLIEECCAERETLP